VRFRFDEKAVSIRKIETSCVVILVVDTKNRVFFIFLGHSLIVPFETFSDGEKNKKNTIFCVNNQNDNATRLYFSDANRLFIETEAHEKFANSKFKRKNENAYD
jgi:hypothetical protein